MTTIKRVYPAGLARFDAMAHETMLRTDDGDWVRYKTAKLMLDMLIKATKEFQLSVGEGNPVIIEMKEAIDVAEERKEHRYEEGEKNNVDA